MVGEPSEWGVEDLKGFVGGRTRVPGRELYHRPDAEDVNRQEQEEPSEIPRQAVGLAEVTFRRGLGGFGRLIHMRVVTLRPSLGEGEFVPVSLPY